MTNKRQIAFDTETTGLEPAQGHRIIEIGCVELIDRQFTGKTFHKYVNPQRSVDPDSLIVHGINDDFLQDKPLFADILEEFIEFVNGAEIIAHNASFDVGFINHEMRLINKKAKALEEYTTVFDTLALARKKFPGQRNSLDAVCKRYKIDLSTRKLKGHGALLDARLLAEVYLLMTAGGQSSLFASLENASVDTQSESASSNNLSFNKTDTIINYANSEELKQHDALLAKIKENSGKCLWENE